MGVSIEVLELVCLNFESFIIVSVEVILLFMLVKLDWVFEVVGFVVELGLDGMVCVDLVIVFLFFSS